MKVALRHEDAIAILEVSGEVDAHNFQVLKAGVTKLLRDGKNRIILSFTDAQELESDVLRELAIVDVLARELSGKIVLAATSEELREGVKLFSKPPVIPILSSVALAIDFFAKAKVQEEAEEPVDGGALKVEIEVKDKEIAALKAQIAKMDPAVVQELRTKNGELQSKVVMLEKQVEILAKDKRMPAAAEGLLEKIDALEASLKSMKGTA